MSDASPAIESIRARIRAHRYRPITDDESRHTVDAGDVYVVLPEHPWWSDHPRWVSGSPLADGFIYASNTNDEWLGPHELAGVLDS